MSTSKFNYFLENARLLSDKFGVVPMLYGSLGLEYLTRDVLGADDIDILVPRVFITERFKKNIDKYGDGTAEFASEGIRIYVEKK